MAKAPRPGASDRADELETAQQVITITIKRPIHTADGRLVDPTHTLAINNIPIRERVICRKATGLPMAAYWSGEDRIDLDSVVVLWWLARRMNGEITLTWDQACEQFPLDLGLDEIEMEIDAPDDEADDPEA